MRSLLVLLLLLHLSTSEPQPSFSLQNVDLTNHVHESDVTDFTDANEEAVEETGVDPDEDSLAEEDKIIGKMNPFGRPRRPFTSRRGGYGGYGRQMGGLGGLQGGQFGGSSFGRFSPAAYRGGGFYGQMGNRYLEAPGRNFFRGGGGGMGGYRGSPAYASYGPSSYPSASSEASTAYGGTFPSSSRTTNPTQGSLNTGMMGFGGGAGAYGGGAMTGGYGSMRSKFSPYDFGGASSRSYMDYDNGYTGGYSANTGYGSQSSLYGNSNRHPYSGTGTGGSSSYGYGGNSGSGYGSSGSNGYGSSSGSGYAGSSGSGYAGSTGSENDYSSSGGTSTGGYATYGSIYGRGGNNGYGSTDNSYGGSSNYGTGASSSSTGYGGASSGYSSSFVGPYSVNAPSSTYDRNFRTAPYVAKSPPVKKTAAQGKQSAFADSPQSSTTTTTTHPTPK